MKIILNFSLWRPPVQVSGSAAEDMKKISKNMTGSREGLDRQVRNMIFLRKGLDLCPWPGQLLQGVGIVSGQLGPDCIYASLRRNGHAQPKGQARHPLKRPWCQRNGPLIEKIRPGLFKTVMASHEYPDPAKRAGQAQVRTSTVPYDRSCGATITGQTQLKQPRLQMSGSAKSRYQARPLPKRLSVK